jgi:hypothetical protein
LGHAADRFVIAFCNPFAARVKMIHEIRNDARHLRLNRSSQSYSCA